MCELDALETVALLNLFADVFQYLISQVRALRVEGLGVAVSCRPTMGTIGE